MPVRATTMLMSCLLAAAASADPPAARTPSELAALSGPAVSERTRVSLVHRDMAGRVQRIELFPAQAALDLLELDPDTLARARKLIVERAALLDAAVRDHLELLTQLASAGQSGDHAEAVRIAIAFTRHLQPLARRGSLETELARVLPTDAAGRLHSIVREYEDALAAEAGKPRFEVMLGESLRLWGEQIRLSFERQAVGGAIFFERIIRELHLRPGQEERTRRRIEQFVEDTNLNPTPEQQRQFGIELVAWLDAAQVKTLLRLLQGYSPHSAKPEAPPAAPADSAAEHAPTAPAGAQ